MLPIFPAQALDSTIITTVWVGLAVITFLNLRFGTTVAGLVVPGYIVPLLLVKPTSAFVIWGEAIVTYLLARLLADRAMRWTGSCTMFGRDRFFAILLISVFVRAVMDGWVLPWTGDWLTAQGYAFDYHNNLYSFGLVVIALTANQMWNAGVVRGMGTFVLYVAITYAIVRWVLIPFTNFDLAGLGFLYEGIAADILASPKAYLILLATAFIASRMNLVYGWEFSGILIPALLALVWFVPIKLLVSLLEAGIIFSLGRLALRLPVFRRMNMEGTRLLLLFFTAGYAYKLALGYVLMWFAPEVKATDYFAFGYLLSSLIAVKMHQKQLTWQIARTTLQTSLMGLAAASLVGYLLVLAVPTASPPPKARADQTAEELPAGSLAELLVEQKQTFYATARSDLALAHTPAQLEAFSHGVRLLARYREAPRPALLDAARSALGRGGFILQRAGDWLVVLDADARRGSGAFAINLAPRTTLLVEVPSPIDEPGVYEAAAQLARAEGHAAFASAGTRQWLLDEGRSNVLTNLELPFARFHALIGGGGVLQVRGLATPPGVDPPAQLWIQRALPPGVNLDRLAGQVGALETRFGRRPSPNRLRDLTTAPLAELLVGRPARLRLIARTLTPSPILRVEQRQRVDGFLYAWLVERKDAIAEAGSGRYQRPELGELLYLQAEVLQPLLRVAAGWDVQRDEEALDAINAAASTLGYRIILHRHARTGEEHAILAEREGGRRQWGTYVVRLGEASPYVVEVPRPLAERETFEYGTRLFTRLDARALLVSGAHPAVAPDGAGDVLSEANPRTLFNLAHQVAVQEMGDDAWVLQVRGKRDRGAGSGPDVVGDFVGKPPLAAQRGRVDAVLDAVRGDADTVALAGQTARARVRTTGPDAQSDFVRRLPGPRFMTLWVSSQARRDVRDALVDDSDRARFTAVGIPTTALDLRAHLARARFVGGLPVAARAALDEYARTRNIAALASAATDVPSVRRLVDLETGRDVLELRDAGGRVLAMRSLAVSDAPPRAVAASAPDAIDVFLDRGVEWLLGAAP